MKRFVITITIAMSFSMHGWCKTASWNIFMLMEAAEFLHQAALKNLNEMAMHKPKNVHIFVLLHYQGDTAMLYKIGKRKLKILQEVSFGKSASDAFIPYVEQLEKMYPAEKHCVILWNHGFGILVPRYNQETEEWEVVNDGENDACPIRSCVRINHRYHRGMLINTHLQTCMNNDDLINLFERLHNEVFGKKVDICGLDMCKGAMIEHAYQLRDHIDFLIGSQECELLDGWPYKIIFQSLQKDPLLQAQQLAAAIIEAYDQYYQEHAPLGIYTQSALCVRSLSILKEQLDHIAELLILLLNNEELKSIVKEVRNQCRSFCDAPMYMDLYAFLSYLNDALRDYNDNEVISQLRTHLAEACASVTSMVVANAAGHAIAGDVYGISVYHPRTIIDPSYQLTPFAQECTWMRYLQEFVR